MTIDEICALPVKQIADEPSHLYLWCPNALLAWGLQVMKAWGFTYKTNLVWYKIRKDGGPDGRGVGFYYRNVTELLLFGVRGSMRTLQPGRRAVNLILTQKREHSRKPDEFYPLIERCSPAPYLELFARHPRAGWTQWGDEIKLGEYRPKREKLERANEKNKRSSVTAIEQIIPSVPFSNFPAIIAKNGRANADLRQNYELFGEHTSDLT